MRPYSKSDNQLDKLLAEARDFAQVYVLARQRQKGCDGMGELATLKEEFRDVVDKVIHDCKKKKYMKEILSGLSFSIEASEVHALLGTNGTGKSALAYLIMGCEGYKPPALLKATQQAHAGT